jgi:predicted N-acyltransferase
VARSVRPSRASPGRFVHYAAGDVNAPLSYSASVLRSIDEVTPDEWDGLLHAGDAPVLRWHWLEALEFSGTAAPARGWTPSHLVLRRGGELVAAVPLYVRTDTYGEFVWTEPLEEACAQIGYPWTPRAVSTVPATPVAGRRLLTGPGIERGLGMGLLVRALLELAQSRGLASVNLHFCAADEVEPLRNAGFLERNQWQYWWTRSDASDFEGFLGRLKGKTRRSIRRERRRLAESGVTVRVVPGDEAPPAWFHEAGHLYTATAKRYDEGEQLIEPGFFVRIGEGPLRSAVRFSAAERDGQLLGLAFEVQGEDALFGRTWGLREEVPYLHFEVAYYASIEHCLAHGLGRFEPGHGGEFKYKRGFQPTRVTTMHRFQAPRLHAAVAAWAAREREWVAARIGERIASGAVRRPVSGADDE